MLRFNDPNNDMLRDRLNEVFRKTWYRTDDPQVLASKEVQDDLRAQVVQRYEDCAQHVLPWVERQFPLGDKVVVELGCGTGASTAAFAQRCRHVHGYEIEDHSLKLATIRLEMMGIENATLHQVEPAELWSSIRRDHPSGTDFILLCAVLEHLTIPERIETLRSAWELLKPGGVLVILECPNRFAYWDHHSSKLPFFHLLPDELAFQYGSHSPRPSFVAQMAHAATLPAAEGAEVRWRHGLGASYHEFEVALGSQYASFIVADGLEQEMRNWFPPDLEERLLQTFFVVHKLDVPLAFTRNVLNLMLRKPVPGESSPTPVATAAIPGDRKDLIANDDSVRLAAAEKLALERYEAMQQMGREIYEREQALLAIKQSRSYQAAAPLRAAGRLVRRLAGR